MDGAWQTFRKGNMWFLISESLVKWKYLPTRCTPFCRCINNTYLSRFSFKLRYYVWVIYRLIIWNLWENLSFFDCMKLLTSSISSISFTSISLLGLFSESINKGNRLIKVPKVFLLYQNLFFLRNLMIKFCLYHRKMLKKWYCENWCWC